MIDISEEIAILKEWVPEEGYLVNFSGGKDSIVILDIVKRSGVKFNAVFMFTSVEMPGMLEFVRNNYPEAEVLFPKMTMYQLILKNNALPLRNARFCCRILKEYMGSNRINVTGIRRQESTQRNNRRMFETHRKDKTKKYLNIIIDWRSSKVWEYIKSNNLPYPELYDQGFKRIGCVGCPQQNIHRFDRFPQYKKAYMNTIIKMLKETPSKWFGTDADLMWEWWMSGLCPKTFMARKREQITIDFD